LAIIAPNFSLAAFYPETKIARTPDIWKPSPWRRSPLEAIKGMLAKNCLDAAGLGTRNGMRSFPLADNPLAGNQTIRAHQTLLGT
jgi:hypothetical protein